MKIEINVDDKMTDTQIIVSCKSLTPEIEKMIAMLRILEKQLTVTKGNDIYFLDVSKDFYSSQRHLLKK